MKKLWIMLACVALLCGPSFAQQVILSGVASGQSQSPVVSVSPTGVPVPLYYVLSWATVSSPLSTCGISVDSTAMGTSSQLSVGGAIPQQSCTSSGSYSSSQIVANAVGIHIAISGGGSIYYSLATYGALAAGTGTITGVTASTGLSGGGSAGAVTVSIAPSYRLPQGCSNGQTAAFDSTSGNWDTCSSAGSGTITGVTAGTGLTGGGSSGSVTLTLTSTPSFTTVGVSGQITSTLAIGTAPFVVTSTTPVANLSIGGNAATATNISTSGTANQVWGMNSLGTVQGWQNQSGVTLGTSAQVPIMNSGATAYVPQTLSGDFSLTNAGVGTVLGLKAVPFCTGFTPTNGQALEYTTGGSPNPCYTAVTPSGSGTVNSGTTPQLAFYSATGTAVSADANVTDTGSSSANLNLLGTAPTLTAAATNANLTLGLNGTGALVFPVGTPANPSITFAGHTQNGLHCGGASCNYVAFSDQSSGTQESVGLDDQSLRIASIGAVRWTATDINGSFDTCADRVGAGIEGVDTTSGCNTGGYAGALQLTGIYDYSQIYFPASAGVGITNAPSIGEASAIVGELCVNGSCGVAWGASGLRVTNTAAYKFMSAGPTSTIVAGFSYDGSGTTVDCGNGTVGDTSCTLQLSQVSTVSNGTDAGYVSLAGNTANFALDSNTVGLMGPTSATFTAYALQLPSTAPSGTQYLGCGTPVSGISACTFNTLTGSGTVTSVAGTVPSGFAIGGSPITTSGTLAITYSVSGSGQMIDSSASNTAGFTSTPTLGVSGTAGTLGLFPASGNFVTTLGSAATASNTVLFPATVPTTLHSVYCVTASTTCTLTDTGYAYNAIPENNLTGAGAAGTITEGGATFSVTRAGIATANLTAPWVFQNTNSSNNNTSITMGISAPGTSTGQTVLNVNGASTGGDLTDWGAGGTWTAGVLSGQTIVASVLPTGAFQSKGTTAGFVALTQGSTSASVAPCNAANTHCIQAPAAVTASVETDAPAQAQGIPTRTGVAATIQDGYSGDANHSATVTIGSGTSIGSTSLCSTAICLVGTYRVNVYVDITTACGTSGTYVVNLIYTDDQGSKTIPVNINGTGAVPATGVLTTTSTANFGENAQIIRSTGAASINYSTTAVACGTAGPMVGKLYLSVEPVQ